MSGRAPQRRSDIEALRILSCWGIVSFHIRPAGNGWAYGGLVAFLALSVWLALQGPMPPGASALRQRALQRARRLLLPWAIWCGVYAAVNAARGLPTWPLEHGTWAALFSGPSVHLWYLPFMWTLLLALDLLRRALPAATLAAAGGLLTAALVATVPLWRPLTLQQHAPLLQWADAAAPVLCGVFLATQGALHRRWRRTLQAAIALATLGLVLAGDWFGPSLLLGLGAMALVASGRLSGRLQLNLLPLSACTFGIYLGHPAVWLALLLHAPSLPTVWLPEIVLLLSFAGVWLLRRAAPRWAAAWS